MTDRPDIPEEALEGQAARIYERSPLSNRPLWPECPGGYADQFRRMAREDLERAAPALRKQGAEEERERLRQELGMLAMMLRENQRHEEGDRNYYDEKDERTHPRRLMHDGKAAAYRHAAANLTPILAALASTEPGEGNRGD